MTAENKRKFLFVVSTFCEGYSVQRVINYKREMESINPKWKGSYDNATIIWKSLSEIKPGEQDIVFAGGRQEDEERVLKLRGSGQLIVRYSQLGLETPYSGRTVEELGYSFLMWRKDHRSLYGLVNNPELFEAIATRNARELSGRLEHMGIYSTGYLDECCKIPVSKTPQKLIEEALANEEKELWKRYY